MDALVADSGELTGLGNISQGRGLEVRPAIGGGVAVNCDGETNVGSVRKPALDTKYRVTSGPTLDATEDTDFAQVEADEENVNPSRFDIFYAEERPFFLEGAWIFDIPSLYSTAATSGSRRIGKCP